MTLENIAEKYGISSVLEDIPNEAIQLAEELNILLEEDEDIPAFELDICW